MATGVARSLTAAQSRSRRAVAAGFLYLAYVLGLVVVAVEVVILLAGSRLVNTDLDKPGPMRLIFSNLAIASFDGIIPDPQNNDAYLVTMHLFLNSFGWEFPSAANKSQTAGIVNPTHNNALYLPSDFVPIGRAVGLPESAWGCFPPNWTGTCQNAFFAAFRRQWPYDSAPDRLSLFIYIFFFFNAAYLCAIEVLIVARPHWLKCRCYFSGLKRFCPCPKGEQHEIERLPAVFWDRYRLWMWPIMPATALLTAFDPYWRGRLMLSWLEWTSDGDMRAMKPRMGGGFITLSCTTFGLGVAASWCILARLLLNRRANWMEQQGAVTVLEGDASVGLDSSPADGRPRSYTDADPDAPVAQSAPPATAK